MDDDRFSSLLIDDGGLAAITAALSRSDPARLVLWHQREASAVGERRAAMVQEHARRLDAGCVIDPAPTRPEIADASLLRAAHLLDAVLAARSRGLGHVVWPVQAGPDPEAICAAVDVATSVSDLVAAALAAGAGKGGVADSLEIEQPLVDLDLAQVVDLADDVGVPDGLFWPCAEGGARPCGTCVGCSEVLKVLERRGLEAMMWTGAGERKVAGPTRG